MNAPPSVWAAWTMVVGAWLYLAAFESVAAMALGAAASAIRLLVYYAEDPEDP